MATGFRSYILGLYSGTVAGPIPGLIYNSEKSSFCALLNGLFLSVILACVRCRSIEVRKPDFGIAVVQ